MSCTRIMRAGLLVLALAAGMTAGCARSAPTRFYTLCPAATGDLEPAGAGPVVVVAPVRVAAYLDHSQIVSRLDGGAVHLAELDRWAEPLDDGIRRVLVENLSRLLPSERVSENRSGGARVPHWRVSVSVSRLERVQDQVILTARWFVMRDAQDGSIAERLSTVTVDVGDREVASMVSAQSRALAELSKEIADAIRAASAGQ